MWTHWEHRRRGLGRRTLAELEAEAGARSYRRICPTSGWRQPEAVALYRATGVRLPLREAPVRLGEGWNILMDKIIAGSSGSRSSRRGRRPSDRTLNRSSDGREDRCHPTGPTRPRAADTRP
ncbi:hypothetical protein [Amycolatopsis magusensis]|uniref:hypothetical protein n=1 Tax=Amycolatopsis magusensis TaxID=882444 RepID=UPI003C2FD619